MAEKPEAVQEQLTTEEALAQQLISENPPPGLQSQIQAQLRECPICGEVAGTADICPHCESPQNNAPKPDTASLQSLGGQEA